MATLGAPGVSPAAAAPTGPARAGIPALQFAVLDARSEAHAAIPTVVFTLRIRVSGEPVQAILLDVQVQIAARRRAYGESPPAQLQELFGAPDTWKTTLRTLPWTRTTVVVPAFDGEAVVELPIACSYDLEVSATKYFAALVDGEVPLEFLFSGSLFSRGTGGALQVTRIGWDCEAEYRLPVATWRAALDRHFPGSAWLRLQRPSFDRLWAYRARHAFTGWEAVIDALLDGQGEP